MKQKYTAPPKLSRIFQKLLLLVALAAFAVTVTFSFLLQTYLSERDTDALLRLNMQDVREDIADASHKNLLKLTHGIADELALLTQIESDALPVLCEKYDVAEINVVDANGFIYASTNGDFIGYDMREGEQASAFMVLLTDGVTELCQNYQPISYGEGISRKYAAVILPQGGFVQVAYDAVRFQRDIQSEVRGVTESRHIGETGCLILADESGLIASDRHGHVGEAISVTGAKTEAYEELTLYTAEVYGERSYCMYAVEEGYTVIAVLPLREAHASRNLSLLVTGVAEALIFSVLFLLLYLFIKKHIVRDLREVNSGLAKITNGNLNTVIDVQTSEELSSLSADINATVDTLKRYIAEAAARIDRELQFASDIQHAALPHIFPPFPNHQEIELFASMQAAKEVGGDFYDFYMLEGEKLVFLIADVSGKGIPAAMFMMSAKTLIKSYAEAGKDAAETFRLTNEGLYLGNDAGMFVTAWMGILDLGDGTLEFVNAGHNPPILCRAKGEVAYLKTRPSFVLGGMEGIKYRKERVTLSPGDTLYLYTDGVTEATDCQTALYGEGRLLSLLETKRDRSPEEICTEIMRDVERFAGDTPQADDMTMLCLSYFGKNRDAVTARVHADSLHELSEFAEAFFTERGALMPVITKLCIAIDEIASNIVKFSGAGEMKLTCLWNDDTATLIFEDDGAPFDPFAAGKPDIHASVEERQIGGLGIHMVKKLMDDTRYEYKANKNILTLSKTAK